MFNQKVHLSMVLRSAVSWVLQAATPEKCCPLLLLTGIFTASFAHRFCPVWEP